MPLLKCCFPRSKCKGVNHALGISKLSRISKPNLTFSQRFSSNIARRERTLRPHPLSQRNPAHFLTGGLSDVRGALLWMDRSAGSGSALGGSALGGSASCGNPGWDGRRQALSEASAHPLQFHGSEPAPGRAPLRGPARGARAPKALHRRQHW